MSKNLNQVQNVKCRNCDHHNADLTSAIEHQESANLSNSNLNLESETTLNHQQASNGTSEQARNSIAANHFEDQSNPPNNNNPTIAYSCIIERLSRLYLSESLADVHFLIKNSLTSNFEKIPAHKLILSIGSQVFMAMFNGNFAESSKESATTNEIEIPDVELEPFLKMLKYLYTDELCVEPDSVMSTLYVAKKYAVNALEKECVDFLKKNLRTENVFLLLQQANIFDELGLGEMCLTVIDKNTIESFSSDAFLDIDLNTLISVLRRDSLGIREFKLYEYLVKWAENKCIKQNLDPVNRTNMQKVLGNALDHIRFSLMTKEEFALIVKDEPSRLIDESSIIDIFVNLTLNETSNYPKTVTNKPTKFITTPRCCLSGKEQMINRFSQVESRWGYSGTSDRVRFSVNRRIYLVGFGLYGSIYGKAEYTATIQLIHYESSMICAQNNTSYTCDGSNKTFRVLFKEPCEIQENVDYIASACLKGPDSFYGTKGLRKVNHEVSISPGCKVSFNFQYASGNNNGTSVEDGQIPELIFFYSCSTNNKS